MADRNEFLKKYAEGENAAPQPTGGEIAKAVQGGAAPNVQELLADPRALATIGLLALAGAGAGYGLSGRKNKLLGTLLGALSGGGIGYILSPMAIQYMQDAADRLQKIRAPKEEKPAPADKESEKPKEEAAKEEPRAEKPETTLQPSPADNKPEVPEQEVAITNNRIESPPPPSRPITPKWDETLQHEPPIPVQERGATRPAPGSSSAGSEEGPELVIPPGALREPEQAPPIVEVKLVNPSGKGFEELHRREGVSSEHRGPAFNYEEEWPSLPERREREVPALRTGRPVSPEEEEGATLKAESLKSLLEPAPQEVPTLLSTPEENPNEQYEPFSY